MSFGVLILLIVGLALVVLTIWNISTLRSLKRGHNSAITDPRYYELKYKQEFFVAIASFIGTVIVVLGYSNMESIKAAISLEVSKKTDSAMSKMNLISIRTDSLAKAFDSALTNRIAYTNKSLEQIQKNSVALATVTEKKLHGTQESLNQYTNSLKLLTTQQSDVEKRSFKSDEQMKSIIGKIQELNAKNILKQSYYIVDSLRFDMKKLDTATTNEAFFQKYYFKDMITTLGDKLPQFNEPPFVIYSADNASCIIKDITKEYFKLNVNSVMSVDGDPPIRYIRFSVLISERQK